MEPGRLTLPELPDLYRRALEACAVSVLGRYDVLGILATGTILRGNPDPRSDLDIHVIHSQPFRERLQEFHADVPCEIFVNPKFQIERYFAEDRADRRPMTAHMFATGIAIFDSDGTIEKLQNEARNALANPPPPSAKDGIMSAYTATTTLEDALDLDERDPEGAALLLSLAIWRLCECRVAKEPGWLPRPKDLRRRLAEIDPESERLANLASSGADLSTRLAAGRELSLRVAGADGFFEWASPREVLNA